MKSKLLFITFLLLLAGSKAIAQTDTLNVYLEKDPEVRFGVKLVFENNSNDTIGLLSKFHNLSYRGNLSIASGISIDFFNNGNPFTYIWDEANDSSFIFNRGSTILFPKSKAKFLFDLKQHYSFPGYSSTRYEVSFFINYILAKYNSDERPTRIKYYRTNRIVLSMPEEKKENQQKE